MVEREGLEVQEVLADQVVEKMELVVPVEREELLVQCMLEARLDSVHLYLY